MSKNVAIEWNKVCPEHKIEILNGKLKEEKVRSSCRLEIAIDEAKLNPGSDSTIITVRTKENPFSFFLRDVNGKYPIFIPQFGVVVTESGDRRSYKQIEKAIRSRRLKTNLQRIESEPEENYENAAARTQNLRCQTWLGLSRDFRIFEIGFYEGAEVWDWIMPKFHCPGVALPEANNAPVRYNFVLGRGIGCVRKISRRLEDGILPILHGTVVDEDVDYNFTTFVTLESGKITLKNLRGTHFLVADGYSAGHMFTENQQKEFDSLAPQEINRPEETVLFFRAEVKNNAKVPRYAFFKTIFPGAGKFSLDTGSGFGTYDSGRVFCVSKLNGKPLPQEEIAVLLKPGETVSFEFLLPHSPISKERAEQLAKQNFEKKHAECRRFWMKKLESAAELKLPERRIDEMVHAGLLHLDLISYGLEPDDTVAPTIGVYSPIGSESSPIIQFFDSMGWHNLARRSLMYFLDKQHDDGFIQNFGGYMLETGAALWSIGEHFRYTQDKKWVEQTAPKIIKSCEYLIKWRERNKREELKGKGYGMIDGKVSDPEDPFHIFMLNGYAYLGLARSAEMLSALNPSQSAKLHREAELLKQDIRSSFFEAVAKSPVVPLANGEWCPTSPPWAEENRGPVSLFAEKGKWFTHGSFVDRDSLAGPLYLIFQEVLSPDEQSADWLINFHNELMCIRNVALSQPYYSRHPWVHLKRGEAKQFLKAYYNCFSGLADRETYTFWEHYFHASPHKTHEEGWFLMETRWMLYMEEGKTLRIFPGIPRAWLENGKRIEIDGMTSYFGPISVRAEYRLSKKRIVAEVECSSARKPECVELRLPHPQGKKAKKVTGGIYDSHKESVIIDHFSGFAKVIIVF